MRISLVAHGNSGHGHIERYDAPGFKRRAHKWAMCSHKGGRCIVCHMKVTHGNIAHFEFDHKEQVNAHADKSDRWGGAIRDWPPFSEQWLAWADTVDLICVDCHQRKHKPHKPQLTLNLEAQARLDNHDAGPVPLYQSALFEAV